MPDSPTSNDLVARILDYLREKPNCRAKDIAKALNCEKSVVNQQLYQMERDFPVKRSQNYEWSVALESKAEGNQHVLKEVKEIDVNYEFRPDDTKCPRYVERLSESQVTPSTACRSTDSQKMASNPIHNSNPVKGMNNIQQLPASPNWQNRYSPDSDRRATLQSRLGSIYRSLCLPELAGTLDAIDGSREKVEQFKSCLLAISEKLEQTPTISVALLGPSRHGKSTLLNALAGYAILPMSDIKPCTASIVSMKRADEWSFNIRFIPESRLKRERSRALGDAREFLKRTSNRMMGDEEPDDPRYLYTTLQRFIQLFRIDSNLPPSELVAEIASAEIPVDVRRLLGQSATPKSANVEQMKTTVEKYLSTKDIFWTIVDTCVISGPFENWHPNLELVDVPGTNDTDPQRTRITNSLRSEAKAVAICTSDSNLGNDIQSWLRNSSVLGDYLEATERSRQQLFILRTKFDSYHPEVDETELDMEDDQAEEIAYRDAINRHKRQQSESYQEMLRNIASPLLPMGSSLQEQSKREEMIERINSIQVFFISALAYDAFEGTSKSSRRTIERLKDQFQNDINNTGIPELRTFVNEMAETYLVRFFFEDLERQLELEVDRLVRFFYQQWTTLEAEVNGGSKAIAKLVDKIESNIIPWLSDLVATGRQQFTVQVSESTKKLNSLIEGIHRNLDQKLLHRFEKWNSYFWNSLQATARKNGVHTTSRGQHIDINQDICGLFVDELSLSWTSFRDDFIVSGSDKIADEITRLLQEQLDAAAASVDMPEATAAIDSIITSLSSVARLQRDEFRRQVELAVQELESIRKPAYETVQKMMGVTYHKIALDSGAGCQLRMRHTLCTGAQSNINNMWNQVRGIVESAVEGLLQRTSGSLSQLGIAAGRELIATAHHLKDIGRVVHRERLLEQMKHIQSAVLLLWRALKDANQLLIQSTEQKTETEFETRARLTYQSDISGKPIKNDDTEIPDEKPLFVESSPVDSPDSANDLSEDESQRFREAMFANPVAGIQHSKDDAIVDETKFDTTNHDVCQDIENADDLLAEQECGLREADSSKSTVAEIRCATDDRPVEDGWSKFLNESRLYKTQKKKSVRADIDDNVTSNIITALEANGWKLTLPGLSEAIGVPAFRLRGVLAAMQRVFNVDGQQTITLCRKSDTVELNNTLLQQEFRG